MVHSTASHQRLIEAVELVPTAREHLIGIVISRRLQQAGRRLIAINWLAPGKRLRSCICTISAIPRRDDGRSKRHYTGAEPRRRCRRLTHHGLESGVARRVSHHPAGEWVGGNCAVDQRPALAPARCGATTRCNLWRSAIPRHAPTCASLGRMALSWSHMRRLSYPIWVTPFPADRRVLSVGPAREARCALIASHDV
jgi:hypothetical protein